MTQKQTIEKRLRDTGSVDNFWAFNNRVTLRLGAVIHVLKGQGWVFDESKSGFIPDTKNWRYVLISAPPEGNRPQKEATLFTVSTGNSHPYSND